MHTTLFFYISLYLNLSNIKIKQFDSETQTDQSKIRTENEFRFDIERLIYLIGLLSYMNILIHKVTCLDCFKCKSKMNFGLNLERVVPVS